MYRQLLANQRKRLLSIAWLPFLCAAMPLPGQGWGVGQPASVAYPIQGLAGHIAAQSQDSEVDHAGRDNIITQFGFGCVTFTLKREYSSVIEQVKNACPQAINYELCMTAAPWESMIYDYYFSYNVVAIQPGQTVEGAGWQLAPGKWVNDSQISYCFGQTCPTTLPLCARHGRAFTPA
jgi:hypothetical protein